MTKHNLSKRERNELRRTEREGERSQERSQYIQNKRTQRLKGVGVVVVLVVIVSIYLHFRANPPGGGPVIEVIPGTINLGTVSQSQGIATDSFTVLNTGDKQLVLTGMETSCMCTQVALVQDGEEGPKFGMVGHGTNPQNWQAAIEPGESAELNVFYDPNAHKNLIGPVTRVISIFSNDPGDKRTDVRIQLNQVR